MSSESLSKGTISTSPLRYAIPVVGGWPYYLPKIYQEQVALEMFRRDGLPVDSFRGAQRGERTNAAAH